MSQTESSQPLEPLNERELEILRLMAAGRTNAEIARALFLTEGTVKWYNTQIFGKLGVRNRVEAIQAFSAPPPASPITPPAVEPESQIIGRTRELGELIGLLTQPSTRLVTLLGPGGIGKSTLAGLVAARLRSAFTDGVFEIAVAALKQADQIYPAIADAIGLKPIGERPLPPQLFAHLAGKRMLLILDNVEQLVEGAQHFTAVVDGAPGVSILTTSRERLNLQDEVVFRLDGLPLPSNTGAEANESVALFLRHALRTNPGMARDERSFAAIARICRLVDGTPLALVLAASSAGALSLAEIGDEVARSLDVLETEIRDMPARHRSMRGVFDATWARLPPAEQQAFAVLSLFRGGFTREAALAVTGRSISTLVSLHSKSLVRHQDRRYSIHELLRQFGATKLTESGGRKSAETAYAEHFLGWLASREPALPDLEMAAVAEIDADFENIRQAWTIGVEDERHDLIEACLASLMQYCRLRGRMPDAHALLSSAVVSAGPARVRARLFAQRADANESIGAFAQEIEDARSALGSSDVTWAPRESIWLLNRHGYALRRLGDFAGALAVFDGAMTLCRQAEDDHSEAETLSHIGMVRWSQGKIGDARILMERAVAIIERGGYVDRVAAQAAFGLAETYVPTGETRKAIPLLERALDVARRARDSYYELESLNDLGVIYGQTGMQQWETAIRYSDETIALAKRIGTPHELGWCQWNLAFAYASRCDFRRAFECLGQSIGWAKYRGDPFLGAIAVLGRADIHFALGLYEMARADIQRASDTIKEIGTTMASGQLLSRSSSLKVRMGLEDASTGAMLEAALAAATAATNHHHRREVLCALCEFHFASRLFNSVHQSARELIAFARAEQHHGGYAQGLLWLGKAQVALGQLAEGLTSVHDAHAFAEANGYHRVRLDTHRALQHAYAAHSDTSTSEFHRGAADALVAEIAKNLKGQPHLLTGLHTL